MSIATGELHFDTKPLTTEGCSYEFFNNHTTSTFEPHDEVEKSFYHMSYMYHAVFGTLATIIVALIYCLIDGFNDTTKIDSRYLAPYIRNYFKSHSKMIEMQQCVIHKFDDNDNQIVQ